MKAVTPHDLRKAQDREFRQFLLYWTIGLNVAFWGMVILMTFYN